MDQHPHSDSVTSVHYWPAAQVDHIPANDGEALKALIAPIGLEGACVWDQAMRTLPWLSTTMSRSSTRVRKAWRLPPRAHISTRSVSPG